MDPDEAVELCDEILELCDDVDTQVIDNDTWGEFSASVREKVGSIKEWVEENDHCTGKQGDALENMRDGVSKWVR